MKASQICQAMETLKELGITCLVGSGVTSKTLEETFYGNFVLKDAKLVNGLYGIINGIEIRRMEVDDVYRTLIEINAKELLDEQRMKEKTLLREAISIVQRLESRSAGNDYNTLQADANRFLQSWEIT